MCIPLQFTGTHCRFLSEAGHTKGGEPKTSLWLHWSPGHNHGQPIVSTQMWLVNFCWVWQNCSKIPKWQVDIADKWTWVLHCFHPKCLLLLHFLLFLQQSLSVLLLMENISGCQYTLNNPLHRLLGRRFNMTAQVAAVQKEGMKHNNVWVVCVTIFYCWH